MVRSECDVILFDGLVIDDDMLLIIYIFQVLQILWVGGCCEFVYRCGVLEVCLVEVRYVFVECVIIFDIVIVYLDLIYSEEVFVIEF